MTETGPELRPPRGERIRSDGQHSSHPAQTPRGERAVRFARTLGNAESRELARRRRTRSPAPALSGPEAYLIQSAEDAEGD